MPAAEKVGRELIHVTVGACCFGRDSSLVSVVALQIVECGTKIVEKTRVCRTIDPLGLTRRVNFDPDADFADSPARP